MNKLTCLIFTILLSLGTTAWAQVIPEPPPPPPPPKVEPIFIPQEEKARPTKGYKEFYQYISNRLRYRYPSKAYRERIQGVVLVEFMVERDGSLTQMKIIKSVGSGCDKVAMKVLKSAPKWRPAKQMGRVIRSKCRIPIRFEIY